VADPQDEQRAAARRALEREYAIDVITARYADEARAGRNPRIEDYVRQYPAYTTELLDFAVYYHTIGIHTELAEGPPDAALAPAAQLAQAQIRARRGAAATEPLRGLVVRGQEVGYQPPQLAAAVGLTLALLAKLEARAIAVATIPPTLVHRLAEALRVAPEAVAAFLGAAGPGTAGAFFYADEQPTQQQEPFLDAVRGSTLPAERQREWTEIVRADAGAGA
jgi:hypothetical protein